MRMSVGRKLDVIVDGGYRLVKIGLSPDSVGPRYQIKHTREEVDQWLKKNRIAHVYRGGLRWELNSHEDLVQFLLRWA
jgi:hypothetical protein